MRIELNIMCMSGCVNNLIRMSLVNICTAELGASILGFSSTSDEEICQASHVLLDKEDKIWNSGEGLPQYLIIGLENLSVEYSHIAAIGFYCWHDYTTNPKTIELEVAQQPQGEFVPWAQIKLKLQNGKQFFNIPELPSCYRVVKLIITQTFGDDQTYLNQVMLMAKPEDLHSNSEMSINQLEYANYQRNMPYTKIKSIIGTKQSRRRGAGEVGDHEDYPEEEYNTNAFPKEYDPSQTNSRKVASKSRELLPNEDEEKDSSFQKNVALLGLSQKMIEMEENMETLRRNLQVLQLKVNVSYQTLQTNIIEKVEKMVDKRLQKLREQLKSEFRNPKGSGYVDLREVKSQKDKIEFISSREMIEDPNDQFAKPKGRSSRDHPKSLHLHHLNQADPLPKQEQKDTVISGLMNRLADKLKERELKVKKMEGRGKEEFNSKRQRNEPEY